MSLKNRLLIILGFVFLIIGAIGVFFPIWPTTPFVLLAAGCFTSSKRLSNWLKKNKIFGEYIINYRERNGLSNSTVIRSLVFLWTMLIVSSICVHTLWLTILLFCIGVAVTIHILWIAKPKEKRISQENLKMDQNS